MGLLAKYRNQNQNSDASQSFFQGHYSKPSMTNSDMSAVGSDSSYTSTESHNYNTIKLSQPVVMDSSVQPTPNGIQLNSKIRYSYPNTSGNNLEKSQFTKAHLQPLRERSPLRNQLSAQTNYESQKINDSKHEVTSRDSGNSANRRIKDETDTEDELVSYSSGSLISASRHPYQDQWKEYYAKLAAIQKQNNQQSAPSQNSNIAMTSASSVDNTYNDNSPRSSANFMYPQYYPQDMAYVMQDFQKNLPPLTQQNHLYSHPIEVQGKPDSKYLEHLKRQESNGSYTSSYNQRNDLKDFSDENNTFLSKSRRDTIKANRYPSVPESINQKQRKQIENNRISSVDLNFKPKVFAQYKDSNDQDTNENEMKLSQNKAIPDTNYENLGISQLSLRSRQISDYNKYLFGDSDEEGRIIPKDIAAKDIAAEDTRGESSNLHRASSKSSESSCGSIQSEANFKIASSGVDKSNTGSSQRNSNEEIPENFKVDSKEPIYQTEVSPTPYMRPKSMIHPSYSQPIGMFPPHVSPHVSNPMLNSFSHPNFPFIADHDDHRRYSIQYFDPHRNSLIQPGGLYDSQIINKRFSMPIMSQPNSPAVKDNHLARHIEKFTNLRKIIASGNKSKEYRLKWVNMLILAITNKLYPYINIKGEYIQKDQVSLSKALFVKSTVSNVKKLLKECDSSKMPPQIKTEVYYIYGRLLMHDFQKYGQDFNLEQDIPQSIDYFGKSLTINSNHYKSLFKLAEIYENYISDGLTEALAYYKESANFGYNRAIYNVAMLYLNTPSFRSLKYLKYLFELSNIDLNEVDLVDDDKDELEEVVGQASYQLGRIYEGIYPEDLAIDSEFVQKSMEIAPLNPGKSLAYYNKAAKLNCLLAQVKLGSVYENGELNRQRNCNKSIQWYIKASISKLPFKRHPDAMLGLSRWYLNITPNSSSRIPSPDPNKALMWCERAIREFDSPNAYFFMGILAEMGISSTSPDVWYRKAYERGHMDAAKKLRTFD